MGNVICCNCKDMDVIEPIGLSNSNIEDRLPSRASNSNRGPPKGIINRISLGVSCVSIDQPSPKSVEGFKYWHFEPKIVQKNET